MIKKSPLGIGIAVIAGAALLRIVGGEILPHAGKKPVSVTVAEVRQGDSETSVMAEGVIVPGTVANVSLLPAFAGQVKRVYVSNGSPVVKGQLLAEIDSTEAQDLLDEAKAGAQQQDALYRLTLTPHRPEDLAQARAEVDRRQAHYDLVRNPRRPEEIRQMRLKLEGDLQTVAETQAKLKALQNGSRAQEVAEAANALGSRQAKLKLMDDAAQRSKILYEKELIPRAEWEQAQADATLAKNDAAAAQERLSLLKEGSRPEEIQAAQAVWERAKAACAQDQEQAKILNAGSRPEEIAEAAASLHQARLAYQILLAGSRREQIEAAAATRQKARTEVHHQAALVAHRLIRAPISGVVIARSINPGEIVAPDTLPPHTDSTDPLAINARSLFVIAADGVVEFQASVDQRYYGILRAGQPAEVQIEALPGRSFAGTVARLNPFINPDKVGRADSYNVTNPTAPLTFSVWARVPNPQKQLVPGQVGLMRLSRTKPGLTIPQSALASYALGEGTVYVYQAGAVQKRVVRYDGGTDGAIHVIGGLRDGEKVVVSDPTGLADGMAVNAAAPEPSP